jgi:hypothetical protein
LTVRTLIQCATEIGEHVADIAIVIAALLGPILAVQIDKLLEARRERKNRRVEIFRRLMVTRATALSPEHVQALNAVPLEFYGKSGQLHEIVVAWRVYLDNFDPKLTADASWNTRRLDLLAALLGKMAKYLGYDFDPVALKNEVYSPVAHGDIEKDLEAIRRGLVAVLQNKAPIAVEISAARK